MVTIHILTLISLLFCNTGARGCSIAQISAITTTVAIIVCAVFIDILNAITIHVGIANITEAVIVRILTFFRATIVTPVRVGIATHQCIEGIQVIVIDHAIIIVVVIAIVWGAISVCVHIVVISFAYVRIAADAVTVRIVKCIVRALVATVWGAIYVCVHIVVMPVALVHIVADAVIVRIVRATIVTPVRVGIATHQCIEGIQVIVIDHAIIIVVVIAIVWGAISVCVHIVVISFAYVRIAADAVTVRIVKCIVRALVATVWGAISVCVHIVVKPAAYVITVADAITVVVGGGATAFACTVYGTETYVCPICGALRITFNSICSALNSITQIPTRM